MRNHEVYALIIKRGKHRQVVYDIDTGKAYWMDESFRSTGIEVPGSFVFVKFLESNELNKELR